MKIQSLTNNRAKHQVNLFFSFSYYKNIFVYKKKLFFVGSLFYCFEI